jgi:hypothetical protein
MDDDESSLASKRDPHGDAISIISRASSPLSFFSGFSSTSLSIAAQVLKKARLCRFEDFCKSVDFYKLLPMPRSAKALIMLQIAENELIERHGDGVQYVLDAMQDLEAMYDAFRCINGCDLDDIFVTPKCKIPKPQNLHQFRDILCSLKQMGTIPTLRLARLIEESLPTSAKPIGYLMLQSCMMNTTRSTSHQSQIHSNMRLLSSCDLLISGINAVKINDGETEYSDVDSDFFSDQCDNWSVVSDDSAPVLVYTTPVPASPKSITSNVMDEFAGLTIEEVGSVSSLVGGAFALLTVKDEGKEEPIQQTRYFENENDEEYIYDDDPENFEAVEEREMIWGPIELLEEKFTTHEPEPELVFDPDLPVKVNTIKDLKKLILHLKQYPQPFDYAILTEIFQTEIPSNIRREAEELIQRYLEESYFGVVEEPLEPYVSQ